MPTQAEIFAATATELWDTDDGCDAIALAVASGAAAGATTRLVRRGPPTWGRIYTFRDASWAIVTLDGSEVHLPATC